MPCDLICQLLVPQGGAATELQVPNPGIEDSMERSREHG